MQAGHSQPQRDRASVRKVDPRHRLLGALLPGANAQGRVSGKAERPDPAGEPRRHPPRSVVIGAHEHRVSAAGELHERVLERLHRAVALEMIGLDVIHDRDRRIQGEEGLVIFVGLHHEQCVAGEQRVATPPLDSAASEAGRLKSGSRQRLARHHRGRGLAMRTGHGH